MNEEKLFRGGRAKNVVDPRKKAILRRTFEYAILGAAVAALAVALIRLTSG